MNDKILLDALVHLLRYEMNLRADMVKLLNETEVYFLHYQMTSLYNHLTKIPSLSAKKFHNRIIIQENTKQHDAEHVKLSIQACIELVKTIKTITFALHEQYQTAIAYINTYRSTLIRRIQKPKISAAMEFARAKKKKTKNVIRADEKNQRRTMVDIASEVATRKIENRKQKLVKNLDQLPRFLNLTIQQRKLLETKWTDSKIRKFSRRLEETIPIERKDRKFLKNKFIKEKELILQMMNTDKRFKEDFTLLENSQLFLSAESDNIHHSLADLRIILALAIISTDKTKRENFFDFAEEFIEYSFVLKMIPSYFEFNQNTNVVQILRQVVLRK